MPYNIFFEFRQRHVIQYGLILYKPNMCVLPFFRPDLTLFCCFPILLLRILHILGYIGLEVLEATTKLTK